MHDPYVTPKADPRLLQDRHASWRLRQPGSDRVGVQENVADWPEQGDLFLEGEIVRYTRGPRRDSRVSTGAAWHHVTAHAEGAPVGYLVNCFNMWGSCIYSPTSTRR